MKGLSEGLAALAQQAHDAQRMVNLLHRPVLEKESGEGTVLSAIAEDTLVDYYTRHKIDGRVYSKKEQEKLKVASLLKPL